MHNRTARASHFLLAAIVSGFIATPVWGQVINEDIKILPSDGATDDYFGWSIAFDNGVIAIGAVGDDENGLDSGSAYLFEARTGAQIAKLLPSDGAVDHEFGYSIAIGDGIVAVGARHDDDNGSASGSAYLFDATTGFQIAKIVPIDGAPVDRFGTSIAIDNGIVAVGASYDDDNGSKSGSAYLFEAITGVQIAKLLPGDGATKDYFGSSIAIDRGIVAVGAPLDNDNGGDSGSVYLFNASTGVQIAKLIPSDGEMSARFGNSVAIDNGVVAIGAWFDDDNGNDSGSAYLFDASTGEQVAKLFPGDGAPGDRFGKSIAIDDGTVAVGAYMDDDNGDGSGSAYLFDAETGTQVAKLLPSDGLLNDYFGVSVAIETSVVTVGVWRDNNSNGTDSGSAYVFILCPADFNNDGTVNTLDFLAYLNAYNAGDPSADMNGDGIINTLDFLAFLNAYNEGC